MVFPLLKMVGIDFALDNLRVVSNLKFVSTLTEMAACNQVQSHVSANNQVCNRHIERVTVPKLLYLKL